MDFTIKQYKLLLNALVAQGYTFQSFADFIKTKHTQPTFSQSPSPSVSKSPLLYTERSRTCTERSRSVILRHDVEAHYERALKFAEIQHALGIHGTYYFRILPKSFKPEIVKKIADLGHEIGYHYDDLAVCKGDYPKAFERFQKNLHILRTLAPVQTICMDGSPLSKFDNKHLWQKYDYKSLGILGEPYLDIDFNKVFYLTDTGRRWDGWKTSVRDKVPQQEEWNKKGLVFHSTQDIIKAIEGKGLGDKGTWRQGDLETRGHGDKGTWRQGDKGKEQSVEQFPNQVLFTFHPQRWTDSPFPWIKELLLQNVKNVVKRVLVK